MNTIIDYFASIPDPRMSRTRRHKLVDILVIALCASICDCDSFTEFAEYGESKKEWFQTFLDLPNGIPSHDTFNRVFCRLDPNSLGECYREWILTLRKKAYGEIVAIDGKTLRRSFDAVSEQSALHMVSAWADSNQMVLGQIAVEEKSNEITAVPKLLEMLDISGCIVTADAMNTQKATVKQIQAKGADYVLAAKDNHPNLSEDIRSYFDRCLKERWLNVEALTIPHTYSKDVNGDHGRVETRRCWATECPTWVYGKSDWMGLKSIALVERVRVEDGKTSREQCYYITSLEADANKIANAVRSHWSIENKLHWSLDVTFGEDLSRIRTDNAPENMAILKHLTLSLIKQETSGRKKSIQTKRHKAGWDNDYLLKVLMGTS